MKKFKKFIKDFIIFYFTFFIYKIKKFYKDWVNLVSVSIFLFFLSLALCFTGVMMDIIDYVHLIIEFISNLI